MKYHENWSKNNKKITGKLLNFCWTDFSSHFFFRGRLITDISVNILENFADILFLASMVSILTPGYTVVTYVKLAAKKCSRILHL